MNFVKTDIEDVFILEPKVFGDNRGWFMETYSKQTMLNNGVDVNFVQDNHSMSTLKNTLRGLHFQNAPKAQSKLVRCTKGKIMDVAVDLRKGSPTYKKWISVELSEENKKQLFIPKGFAHGFLALTDNVEVEYKVDEYYSAENDRSIKFDDKEIGVDWNVYEPILSEKDKNAPKLMDSDINFKYKFMVTGVNGQLGHDVVLKLKELGHLVVAPDKSELDITNEEKVFKYILNEKPNVVIHCAAYTNVDKAEEDRENCYNINVKGTEYLVNAIKKINAKLVYISTDYVFDGLGIKPYREDDVTKPINYYGYTKEQGEKIVQNTIDKHFVVRTSWVYGVNGNNFVKTMLELSKKMNDINVVSDQVGSPTYTKDLAEYILQLVQTKEYGIYHATNDGYCSWADFAEEIFRVSNIEMKVNRISTSEYPTKAKRPFNSRLSSSKNEKISIRKMPEFKEALYRYIEEINGIVNY